MTKKLIGYDVIALSGQLGSGKDCAADVISSVLTDKGYTIKRIAFADGVKEIASILTGIDVSMFEDKAFKMSYMPAQWNRIKATIPNPLGGQLTSKLLFATRKDAIEHFVNIGYKESSITTAEERITYRTFLQLIGTDALRDIVHPNVWINKALTKCREYLADPAVKVIITDCRFINEANMLNNINEFENLKHATSAIVRIYSDDIYFEDGSKVNRKQHNDITTVHESETQLDDYTNFTYTVSNNGTLYDFKQAIRSIAS